MYILASLPTDCGVWVSLFWFFGPGTLNSKSTSTGYPVAFTPSSQTCFKHPRSALHSLEFDSLLDSQVSPAFFNSEPRVTGSIATLDLTDDEADGFIAVLSLDIKTKKAIATPRHATAQMIQPRAKLNPFLIWCWSVMIRILS